MLFSLLHRSLTESRFCLCSQGFETATPPNSFKSIKNGKLSYLKVIKGLKQSFEFGLRQNIWLFLKPNENEWLFISLQSFRI